MDLAVGRKMVFARRRRSFTDARRSDRRMDDDDHGSDDHHDEDGDDNMESSAEARPVCVPMRRSAARGLWSAAGAQDLASARRLGGRDAGSEHGRWGEAAGGGV